MRLANRSEAFAKEHLGIDDVLTFQEADRMRVQNPEIFEEYARNDARYTFRLWPMFTRELERHGLMKVYQTQKSVALATSAMEDAGLKVDVSRIEEMKRDSLSILNKQKNLLSI
jgi:DNA polymerase I-like protein with 3'-5' exonuclease and polymerase domains